MSDHVDLHALAQDPQAAALLKDPKAINALMSSPEAQRLMALLSQRSGGTDRLRSAAIAASRGDTTALTDLLRQVSQSPQGEALLRRLSRGGT